MSRTVAQALQEQEIFRKIALSDAYREARTLAKHILEYPTPNVAVNDSIFSILNSVILAQRQGPINEDETKRILAAMVERNMVDRFDLADKNPEEIQEVVRLKVWMLEVGLA